VIVGHLLNNKNNAECVCVSLQNQCKDFKHQAMDTYKAPTHCIGYFQVGNPKLSTKNTKTGFVNNVETKYSAS